MGNIITTATGDLTTNGISASINGTSSNDSPIKSTSFAKIINDILLELDLYTGNKDRSEINYGSTLTTSGKDINGIPYTRNEDVSLVYGSAQLPQGSNDDYKLGMTNSNIANKNYNMNAHSVMDHHKYLLILLV
jgi:hypothetical protein